MRLFKNFATGLKAYVTATKIIFSGWMWLSFSIPLLLSLGLYWGGDLLTESLEGIDFKSVENDNGKAYLFVGIQSILVYVTKYMNKYVVLALLAPLLAGLSTRTEYLLTGNTYPFNFKLYVEDVKRALIISFRNMGMQMLVMAVFFLITLVYQLPAMVNEIVYFTVAFYFYGFSFMDYPMERRRLSVRDSIKFTRRHAGAAFALGGVYGGLFLIPYGGVVVAPILGVVAGTIVMHELVDLSKNPYAQREGQEAMEDSGEAAAD